GQGGGSRDDRGDAPAFEEEALAAARDPRQGGGVGDAMIQMGTILEGADNSGARKIACIRMRGGSAGQYAGLGDIITASVKEAAPDSPFVEKHGKRVVSAVIARTRPNHR